MVQSKCYIIALALFPVFQLTLSGQHSSNYSEIDSYVKKVPKKESKDIARLTAYLVAPFETDIEKVRSIYSWVGNNIKYDYKAAKSGKLNYNHRAEEVFRKKKGVCSGYAKLFSKMARLANIVTSEVDGYAKTTDNSNSNFNFNFNFNFKEANHVWNAVRLDNKWYLLDVTWDANLWNAQDFYKTNRQDQYFLTSPRRFLQDHMPDLPMWQLLSHPYNLSDFINDKIPESDTLQRDGTINFRQTISNFMLLPRSLQRVYEYRQTFQFNPTSQNADAMAHGLLDYAGILTDSIDVLRTNSESVEEIKLLTQEVIILCKESEKYTTFHDWQTRMYANALLASVVLRYNDEIGKDDQSEELFILLLNDLQKSESLINGVPDDFMSKGIKIEIEQLTDAISKKIKSNN